MSGAAENPENREDREDREDREESPWLAVAAFTAAIFLAFLAGAGVMHFGWWPAKSLERGYKGGEALWNRMTGYDDPFYTDFWKRARTEKRGVLRHDGARAQPGLTLYSSGDGQKAFLIDMDGNVVHEWGVPYSRLWDESGAIRHPAPDEYVFLEKAHVFPNGDLLALYTAIGDTPWGYGLVKMDADSNVIWKYLQHAHHSFDLDDEGNVYVLTHEISEAALPKIDDLPKPRIDDFVVVLSPDGKEQKKLWINARFAESPFGRKLYFIPWDVYRSKGDYLHANSVHLLRDAVPGIPASRAGQVLLSLREVSTVAIADFESDSIPWALSGPWVRQHDAEFLPNGRLLLFDNEGNPGGHGVSRVLELDPATYQVHWSYAGREGEPLDSVARSSQNRLANGNTLVVESMAGRVIEVTPGGDIVWEFVNPVRGGKDDEQIPVIFWVERLDPERDFTPEFRAKLK